jgi:hypothetical protein
MKPVPLQLITIRLDNGQQGVFVGAPLVSCETTDPDAQVEDIWFSDVQELPPLTSLDEVLRLVQEQLCRCQAVTH